MLLRKRKWSWTTQLENRFSVRVLLAFSTTSFRNIKNRMKNHCQLKSRLHISYTKLWYFYFYLSWVREGFQGSLRNDTNMPELLN